MYQDRRAQNKQYDYYLEQIEKRGRQNTNIKNSYHEREISNGYICGCSSVQFPIIESGKDADGMTKKPAKNGSKYDSKIHPEMQPEEGYNNPYQINHHTQSKLKVSTFNRSMKEENLFSGDCQIQGRKIENFQHVSQLQDQPQRSEPYNKWHAYNQKYLSSKDNSDHYRDNKQQRINNQMSRNPAVRKVQLSQGDPSPPSTNPKKPCPPSQHYQSQPSNTKRNPTTQQSPQASKNKLPPLQPQKSSQVPANSNDQYQSSSSFQTKHAYSNRTQQMIDEKEAVCHPQYKNSQAISTKENSKERNQTSLLLRNKQEDSRVKYCDGDKDDLLYDPNKYQKDVQEFKIPKKESLSQAPQKPIETDIWSPKRNSRLIFQEESRKPRAKEQVIQDKNKKRSKTLMPSQNPSGLPNIGLSCYLNSILQCLFYTEELAEIEENYDPNKETLLQKIIELRETIQSSSYGKRAEIESLIQQIMSLIKPILQRRLQGCGGDPYLGLSAILQVMAEEEKEMKLSQIKELFTTQSTNITQCVNDCNPLIRSENSMLIKVEMRSYLSLQECINNFKYNRNIPGFPCDECNKDTNAYLSRVVDYGPQILIVNVDKIQNPTYPKNEKIHKISFNDQQYQLYGIVQNSGKKGSSSIGHCTSYVQVEKGKWYYFSDSVVYKESNIGRHSLDFIYFFRRINKS